VTIGTGTIGWERHERAGSSPLLADRFGRRRVFTIGIGVVSGGALLLTMNLSSGCHPFQAPLTAARGPSVFNTVPLAGPAGAPFDCPDLLRKREYRERKRMPFSRAFKPDTAPARESER
jgi:hypothetical protein